MAGDAHVVHDTRSARGHNRVQRPAVRRHLIKLCNVCYGVQLKKIKTLKVEVAQRLVQLSRCFSL